MSAQNTTEVRGSASAGAEESSGGPELPAGAELPAELQEVKRDLRLWKHYPDACKLIQTQSEVYHAAEEGADKEKVFVYPIIAAYGSTLGAADPSEEEMGRKMSLVELLAVVDKAPAPTPEQTLRLVSKQCALCLPLADRVTTEEKAKLVALLEELHDIAEYLQLEKRLCERIKLLSKAEEYRKALNLKASSVLADTTLGPVLRAALDTLAATPVPAVLRKVAEADRKSRELLNLSDLLTRVSTLEGALGWPTAQVRSDVDTDAFSHITSQLLYLFGEGIAGGGLSSSVIEALNKVASLFTVPTIGEPLLKLANRVVEGLTVLGKGQEALDLVQEGGIPLPKHLLKTGRQLVVIDP